jgi:DNA-directed RNA polymerase subunit A'
MMEISEYEIRGIEFLIPNEEIIKKLGKVEINIPDTYDEYGYPIKEGLMDTRMGVIDPGLKCETCGGNYKQCPGHFGYISFEYKSKSSQSTKFLPIIHPLFAKHIYTILNNTCEHCYRYLDNKRGKRTKVTCPHCGKHQSELKFEAPYFYYLNKQRIDIKKLEEWLDNVDSDTMKKIFKTERNLPPARDLLIRYLLVPPPKVRPSITLESGERSEDDLTHMLAEILRIKRRLIETIEAGAPHLLVQDHWDLLQYHVSTYIDNNLPKLPQVKHKNGKPLKSLSDRLRGKEGRLRYTLSGKRVNFSARTVISPDPNIDFNEVGVPYTIAEKQTVPFAVNNENLEFAKQLIRKTDYPRALYVINGDVKIKITDSNREKLANEIQPGWIIERQLMKGDVVLFNRQPSLHRVSMMAHYVVPLPGKTFRINPLITPPYNADFDGDEMNLHVLQSEEARVEAIEIMDANKHVISIRNGRPIIKHSEDAITGLFFLSKENTILNKVDALRLLGIINMEPEIKDEYTGRELLSYLLPKDLNLEANSKIGDKLIIKNGKIISGIIDSRSLDELLKILAIKYGDQAVADFINKSFRIGIEYLTIHGITVSLKNYYVDEGNRKEIRKILKEMDDKIELLIERYNKKILDKLPGLTLKESLERQIISVTSEAREKISKILKNIFGLENSSIIMATIGARGSMLNVIQMSGSVGQQIVRNKRPWRGYYKRILPFYEPGKLTGRERGYVYGCFVTGLEIDEFWNHAIAGRESIVNTAMRTSKSGYLQRKLINALSDLYVEKDLSTRTTSNRIIQIKYGGDGRNPIYGTIREDIDDTRKDDIDTV